MGTLQTKNVHSVTQVDIQQEQKAESITRKTYDNKEEDSKQDYEVVPAVVATHTSDDIEVYTDMQGAITTPNVEYESGHNTQNGMETYTAMQNAIDSSSILYESVDASNVQLQSEANIQNENMYDSLWMIQKE